MARFHAGFQTREASQAELDATTPGLSNVFASPNKLSQSVYYGAKSVQAVVVDFTTDVATGDGKFYFMIPAGFNAMNLASVTAVVITAGVTGTLDIQIHNVTQAADMLTTKLTVDSGETNSVSAATPAVIDTANDDVATNDLIRVDVDAIPTTAPKGLIVTLGFKLPSS